MPTATAIQNERLPREFDLDDGRYRDSVWYYSDDSGGNQEFALTSAGLPAAGSAHPTKAGLYATSYSTRVDESHRRVYIRVGYRPRDEGRLDTDPRIGPGYRRTDTVPVIGTEQVNRNADGTVYFAEPATVEVAAYEVRCSVYTLSTPNLGFLESRVGTYNTDGVTFPNLFGKGQTRLYGAGTLLYRGWDPVQEVRDSGGNELLVVTHRFLARAFSAPFANAWQHAYPDYEPQAGGLDPITTLVGPFDVLEGATHSGLIV